MSLSRDGNIVGGTAPLPSIGVSEGCPPTNDLGEVSIDSIVAGEAMRVVGEVDALDVCVKDRGFFKILALKARALSKNGLVLGGVYFHVTGGLVVLGTGGCGVLIEVWEPVGDFK